MALRNLNLRFHASLPIGKLVRHWINRVWQAALKIMEFLNTVLPLILILLEWPLSEAKGGFVSLAAYGAAEEREAETWRQ